MRPESPTTQVNEEKDQAPFERLIIDPEMLFMTLPMKTVLQIGWLSTSTGFPIDPGQENSVESPVCLVWLSVRGQTDSSMAVASGGASPVPRSKFLEDLGFEINPASRLLEPSGGGPHLFGDREE